MKRTIYLSILLGCTIPCSIQPAQAQQAEQIEANLKEKYKKGLIPMTREQEKLIRRGFSPIGFKIIVEPGQDELAVDMIPLQLAEKTNIQDKAYYINAILYNKNTPIETKVLQIEQIAIYLKQEFSLHAGWFYHNDPEYIEWIKAEQVLLSNRLKSLQWQVKSSGEIVAYYGARTAIGVLGFLLARYLVLIGINEVKENKSSQNTEGAQVYRKDELKQIGNDYSDSFNSDQNLNNLGQKRLDEHDVDHALSMLADW